MGIRQQDNTYDSQSQTSYPFQDLEGTRRQPAEDENTMAREMQKLLNRAGITSSQADTDQFYKAVAMLIANGNLYTTSGTANAIILNVRTLNSANTNSLPMLNLHFDQDGVIYEFDATFSNTGAVTVEITGFISACNIVDFAGNSLLANAIVAGNRYTLKRDKANNRFIIVNPTPTLLTQQRIELSYNSPTSLNYSAGGFVFDDFSGSGVVSAGTLNLTGLTANASWYVFAIANPTTGETQIQHYDSLTPTPPTGFTKKKLLFAFITNANSQLRAMKIHNLPNAYKVEYVANIHEYLNYAVQIAGELKTFTVPSGIEVEVEGSYRKDNHGANNMGIGFTHPSKTSIATDGTFFSYTGVANATYDLGAPFKSFTNTSRQIRISTTGSNGGPTGLNIIYTWGYTIYL